MRAPLAHLKAEAGVLLEHDLEEHLRSVGALAGEYAAKFGSEDWGRLAGLWHDLGKYRSGFQAYIRVSNDPDAHIEGKVAGADKTHSAAGALHAIETFQRSHTKAGLRASRVLAYVIASHHAGLYDWISDQGEKRDLQDRLFSPHGGYATEVKREYDEARAAAPKHILDVPPDFDPSAALVALPGLRDNPLGFSLAVRMLFSCLVDADFLDTERFLNNEKFSARSKIPRIDELRQKLDEFIQQRDRKLKAEGQASTRVNVIRDGVLAQCRAKGALKPGLFSLEVPTGGGKTLSSLAFALDHAVSHHKERVIYVIPFTSIIEQTADVFRDVFNSLGPAAVIEHHSQVESDPAKENVASRLACENWDAPLVVTTNVQLFESLFAARTSRCRKLHRLVNSVIVLDEAQQLPPQFLQPILDVLNLLVQHYGATVVLCTATQPALQSTSYFDARQNLRGLPAPTPIVDESDALFEQLKRVDVRLPVDWNRRQSMAELAEDLSQHDCVLAIVDRKRDARELHALLPEGAVHLSSWMCGAHRSNVIKDMKARLEARATGDSRPLRVVSTQLIEAGVDLDFPVVFRALAGLDSIAQAAGRCNREGRLERGQVVVFVPPQEPPAGHLRKAAQATRSVLHGRPAEPLTPELFRQYFKHFYADCDLDARGIISLLKNNEDLAVRFRTAAREFRLIDEDTVPVVVIYRGPHRNDHTVDAHLGVLARAGPSRWLLRSLQRYAVMLPRKRAGALAAQGSIAPAQGLPDWFVQQSDLLYHPDIGLDPADTPYDPVSYTH